MLRYKESRKYVGCMVLVLGILPCLVFWYLQEWNMTEAACLWLGLPFETEDWNLLYIVFCFTGILVVTGGVGSIPGERVKGYHYAVLMRYHSKKRFGRYYCRTILQSTLFFCGVLYCSGTVTVLAAALRGITLQVDIGQFLLSAFLFSVWQVMMQMTGGLIGLRSGNSMSGFLFQITVILLSLPEMGGAYLPGNYGMYMRSCLYSGNGYSLWIVLPIELIVIGIICAIFCGGRYGKDC